MPSSRVWCWVWVSLIGAVPGRAQESGIRIRTYPDRPFIERDATGQYLNFDFGLENDTDRERSVERVDLAVFDGQGRLVRRQFVWAKGAASPGLLTVPDRTIPAKSSLSFFNPFYVLPADLPLARLRYEFVFETKGIEPTATAVIDVNPIPFRAATRLRFPVDGPAVVYDGHDFYSHHRRIPLGGPFALRAGLKANPVRYANDLTPVGPAGELARGSLADPKNWYAYGAVVRAPAAGEVVSAANDVPDNRIENGELVTPPDAANDQVRGSLGNHVIIRHADGEYTMLAHLLIGSVPARVGDRVAGGDSVGRIGFSGDTGFHVHVHHMLVTGQNFFSADALPMYYDRVRRVALPLGAGSARSPVLMGARLDTGDLVVSVR